MGAHKAPYTLWAHMGPGPMGRHEGKYCHSASLFHIRLFAHSVSRGNSQYRPKAHPECRHFQRPTLTLSPLVIGSSPGQCTASAPASSLPRALSPPPPRSLHRCLLRLFFVLRIPALRTLSPLVIGSSAGIARPLHQPHNSPRISFLTSALLPTPLSHPPLFLPPSIPPHPLLPRPPRSPTQRQVMLKGIDGRGR